jgi:hypothetical protein
VSKSGWGRVFAASQAVLAAVEANDDEGAQSLVSALLGGDWPRFVATSQAREARQRAQAVEASGAKINAALIAAPSADVVAAFGWEATLTQRMPTLQRPSPILVERARKAMWWKWRATADMHMSAYGRDVVEGQNSGADGYAGGFDTSSSDGESDADSDGAELALAAGRPQAQARHHRDWSRLRARRRLMFDDSSSSPGSPRPPEDRASLALAYYMASWSRFFDEERKTGRGTLRAFPWIAALPELIMCAKEEMNYI